MRNAYLQKMAQVLVKYCLEIQAGDLLRIQAGIVALPLLQEIYREAIDAGAFIVPRLTDSTLDEILLRYGSTEQLRFVSPSLRQEIETIGKWLDILSDTNTHQFTSIDPERLAIKQSASESMQRLYDQREAEGLVRSCVTTYPTEAYAQEAGMSLMEYTDFFANACFLHQPDPAASWDVLRREQQRVVDFLNGCRQLRITAPGTELEFRCDSRTWINGAGKQNLPDGEVYTAPIEDSMQGSITFSYPSIFNGTIAERVQLKLLDGVVVQAAAQRGQEFLNSMLALDAGARYVGEVAFGMNYGIQRATGHAIFDEKIGGTMHIALGSACPGTGGSNQSMLHWDLVCDLHEGEVYADGELCYKNGRFLL